MTFSLCVTLSEIFRSSSLCDSSVCIIMNIFTAFYYTTYNTYNKQPNNKLICSELFIEDSY